MMAGARHESHTVTPAKVFAVLPHMSISGVTPSLFDGSRLGNEFPEVSGRSDGNGGSDLVGKDSCDHPSGSNLRATREQRATLRAIKEQSDRG